MRYFIFLITLVFLFTGFLGTSSLHIQNPFIAYVFYTLDFALAYFPLFFIAFCVGLFLIIRNQPLDRKDYLKQTVLISAFQVFAGFLASAFFAFVLLLVIAVVELNIFSVIMNFNPKILGVTIDTKVITQKLTAFPNPPKIIASDRRPQKEVAAIAQATIGTTNFYGENMLTSIPSFLVLPISKTSSGLALIDNYLIVTAINVKDMQAISPVLGNLFVKEYFSDRPIRFYPKVSVMTDHQYAAFRKKDSQEKLAKATIEVQKMDESISSVSAAIQKDKDAISANQNTQTSSMKQRDKEYNTCLSTGTYIKGSFQARYTKDYCQQILDKWNNLLTQESQQEENTNSKLSNDNQLLKNYEYYDTFFKAQKTLLAISTNNIPAELGVFEPKDSIKIVFASSNSHDVADYFETLVHEYLHYASYTEGKRLDSSFFEEGLTEYFARQTIKDNLDTDTDLGYPVAVKIIKALTQRIAEADFEDIYFTKDDVGLEHKLDLVYGDNFYKNNYVLFESLQYTADPQQALEIANTIMKKIGGIPLTEKDLFSTQSDF
jgi:hypothetical protein